MSSRSTCSKAPRTGTRSPRWQGASADGRWEVEPYAEAPYRTRLLVVRPERPSHFNGTVVVNWQNVSAGAEPRALAADEPYRGYAWVGVSAQEVGIHGFPAGMERYGGRGQPLVVHDPERYGDLHHPGDQASFDIFSQAGRALGPGRSTTVDPLAGLHVRRLIATGGSQSAMRLVAYLNAFHRDSPVFDGFLLSVWEGRAPRPEEGAIASGVRTTIRTDLTTPVVVVNSEFEAHHLAGLPVTDTEHLRIWEVAGTPHGVARRRTDQPDRAGRVVNRLSIGPVHEAALRARPPLARRRCARALPAAHRGRPGASPDAPPRRPRERGRRHPPPRARGGHPRVSRCRVRHRPRTAVRFGPSARRRRGARRSSPPAPRIGRDGTTRSTRSWRPVRCVPRTRRR